MLKYNIKNALWSLLILTLISSCNDNASSSKIQLFSFGPSGVKHGDEIKFIGQNLDKVTSIVLPPNIEIPASGFTSKSSTLIELVVPEEAEAGKVTLKTPQGDIETKSMLNFLVPVVITSITEEAKPGTNISIKGTLVNWIESVTFNDGKEVTEFVSKTTEEVVVTVPMDAKTGFLIFATGGTDPLTFSSENQLTVTLPAVSSLNPSSIKHTDNLTVDGTDLDLVTQIAFPDGSIVSAGDFVSQSETEIVVTVPATSTSGALTLTVSSGVEVVTDQTLTIILPIVTAISPSDPSTQETAGTTLTFTGTDLDLVAKIKFPGVSTPVTDFTTTGTTQISVVVPAGAQGGTLVLTTIHDFTVAVTVSYGNQLTLVKVIYDDAPKNGFGKWGGWGTATSDIANTENPRVGTVSIKASYNGDWSGTAQFGGGSVSTSGLTYFAFSIYGETGTDGKSINVNVSGQQKQVVIAEGKWTDVKILLSDVGSPASVSEVWFQDTGWTGTVYIDQIGLK